MKPKRPITAWLLFQIWAVAVFGSIALRMIFTSWSPDRLNVILSFVVLTVMTFKKALER